MLAAEEAALVSCVEYTGLASLFEAATRKAVDCEVSANILVPSLRKMT